MPYEYSYPTRYSAVRRGSFAVVDCSGDKVRTVQADKDACDINKIMARYAKTGELPPGIGIGSYGDFSEVGEYLDAVTAVERAKEQFAALPSKVRERFANDPARLLAFVHDSRNLEEARALGLLGDVPAPATPEPVAAAKPPDVSK